MRNANGLQSDLVETKQLSAHQTGAMFGLMEQYFEGVDREKFRADLLEKRWAIVLRDPESMAVKGFSTITLMETVVAGQAVKAFYSGDTIIDRACWSPFSLEKEWTPLVFSHVLADPDSLWYWFMVCKGFRTYKYFPVHFHQFYPSPDQPMPAFERQVLEALATSRFGQHYRPESFVISCPADYRLRPGVGDISSEKSKNRYIHFFETSNPGWLTGEELACLTPLRLDNIKSALRRFLPDHPAKTA